MERRRGDKESLRKLKSVVTDVDGVLTNAIKFYGNEGLALLGFNVRDGLGLHLLKMAGISLAFVTTTESPVIARRAADLGIHDVFQNVHDKGATLRAYRDHHSFSQEDILYVGDDLWDLEAFAEVGVRVAVADAALAVRNAADWITASRGGEGALREVADAILQARGVDPRGLLR